MGRWWIHTCKIQYHHQTTNSFCGQLRICVTCCSISAGYLLLGFRVASSEQSTKKIINLEQNHQLGTKSSTWNKIINLEQNHQLGTKSSTWNKIINLEQNKKKKKQLPETNIFAPFTGWHPKRKGFIFQSHQFFQVRLLLVSGMLFPLAKQKTHTSFFSRRKTSHHPVSRGCCAFGRCMFSFNYGGTRMDNWPLATWATDSKWVTLVGSTAHP